MTRIFAATLVALATIAVAACGTPRRGEPFVGAAGFADSQLEQGRAAFAAHCQRCHPGGEAALGPSLNDKALPRFLMKFQVRHGLGAMPAIPPERLSDDELDAVVAYLKALRGRSPG
jgi:mono/diheme cytochrome c family protein